MIELKNSRTTYLGRASGGDKYTLDGFIGAVQMREPGGQWQDIKPCLVRDAGGWHIDNAPYYAEIRDDGSRLFCPVRNERGKYLRLPSIALFSGLARNILNNPAKLDGNMLPNQITMPTAWGEIRIIFSNTGMHFEILFRETPPSDLFGRDSPKILLDAETAGLDINELLKSTSGTGIPKPRLIATNQEVLVSESQERWLDWSYKNGQMELGFDFGSLPFPILLKNTTIDIQVGASADDGFCSDHPAFDTSFYLLMTGNSGYHPNARSWYRYTGITIPQGSNVDIAYLTLDEADSSGNPLTKIWADDQNAPTAPTSLSDYGSRTTTTAGVDEDGDPGANGWHNTASIVSVIQELVTSYDYSNGVIQILHKSDGSTGDNYRFSHSWDYSGHTYGPKLHIEYTAGGATAKTAAETGSGADGSAVLATMVKSESGGGSESVSGRGLVINDAGVGAEAGMIPGIKSVLGGEGGIGHDALKALIETPGAGADMKLPGRSGQVRIPSKGVSL